MEESRVLVSDLVLEIAGDVNLRRCLDFDATCLDEVAAELSEADVRIANLEGAFADPDEELAYKSGWYHCQPDMAKCLVGRFDMVGCANNVHYGQAIVDSAAVLDAHGVLHAGSGPDLESAHRPAILARDGFRVGLLAYTSVFEPVGHSATETSVGVATIQGYTSYEPNPRVLHMPGAPAVVHTWANAGDLARACADVRELSQRADFVVVNVHFGVTTSPQVHEYQREIAHALIDAGAQVVAGSHSHTPGGVEFYGRGVVFYSLGNFCFNTGFHPQATRDGMLAKLALNGTTIERCAVLPAYRDDSARTTLPDPAQGEGLRIAEMIAARSAEFHTTVKVSGQELLLQR